MKKLLLASTALVLSAGIAAADVTVGGSGRMGIVDGFGDFVPSDTPGEAGAWDETDVGFTSRIRISFSASGETDGGLTFGGSIRADNSGGGNSGTAGSVFISGAFGKLTMGDVSGAAEAAVGDVSGVGLTGLGDFNEATYVSNIGSAVRSAMRYDYTTGALGFHVSADNPAGPTDIYSVAVSYNAGGIKAGLGYETGSIEEGTEVGTDGDAEIGGLFGTADFGVLADDLDLTHIIVGGAFTFGAATVKAQYGTADLETGGDEDTLNQYALSLDYKIDALTLTAYYRNVELEELDINGEAYGIGATYSLGGGANLVGGVVQADVDGESETGYDFGINFTF